jgi:hypothetical protein
VGLGRVISFLQEDRKKVAVAGAKELGSHLKTVYLSSKANFLLDTTLGLINIEQNGTIKIFSVAAVVLLPPTLVASVYGMNFEVMPELKWLFGYRSLWRSWPLRQLCPTSSSRRRAGCRVKVVRAGSAVDGLSKRCLKLRISTGRNMTEVLQKRVGIS